ncbi:MAG: glycosyltransferase family 4 protein [Bacteroidales bacterium]|nr:glycosyltransferase family 4 protein [Bacteroidales bacterium]
MKRLLLIVNEDRFFLSHRQEIALMAKKEGFDVTVVCKDTGRSDEVRNLGLSMIELPINPTGTNLKEEFSTLLFLKRLYAEQKPDIVHHVGLKNILWGGIAAKLNKIPGVVNAVCGLGVLFAGEEPSLKARAVMKVMSWSNKGMNISEIFQNNDDMSLFKAEGVVTESQCDFIKGSGVNLDNYHYMPEPTEGKIKVLFTGRMVKEKGVITLIEAAEKLRSEFTDKVEFLLCGDLSCNPDAIKRDELLARCDGGYIQWLGFRRDVLDLLLASHVMAFPSFYREGVPLSLIEACAVGRPIVTCDSVGCRDTVDDGVNGFLISPRDSDALAEKLKILFLDKALRDSMGRKGRKKAEREFSIQMVVDKHMNIYSRLSGEA